MFDLLISTAKKLWNDKDGKTVIIGIIASLVSSFLTWVFARNAEISLPIWVFALLSAVSLVFLVAIVMEVRKVLTDKTELKDEQLGIIDYLYQENRLCTQKEICNAVGIERDQDAILFISTLCDDMGYLRRIRGRQGISGKNWVTGEQKSSPSVPTKYALQNKGRELAMKRYRATKG